MDTLEKHNKEVDDMVKEIIYGKDVDWEWDIPGETITYYKIYQLRGKIKEAIIQSNKSLPKKIAEGEIERLNELLKILDWHEPYRVCLEDQLTHWQQVLQDLEK